MVGIFIDEALTLVVNKNAEGGAGRRVKWQAHKALVHVNSDSTRRHPHGDTAAGIAGVADRHRAAQQIGGVLLNHCLVHHKASSTQHNTALGAHKHLLHIDAQHHPDYPFGATAVVDHQAQCAAVEKLRNTARRDGGGQGADKQRPAVVTFDLQIVAARRGRCQLVEWVAFFIAGV